MARIKPPPVHRIALIQMAILGLVTCMLGILVSVNAGYSALVGGFIQIIPQAWFAYRAYKITSARQAQQMVNAIYQAETGKIILTSVLFAIVFSSKIILDPFVLFLTFGLMIIVQFLSTPWLLKKSK